MKTILLYVAADQGLASRIAAGVGLARAHAAHLHCIQVTPFDMPLTGDPAGNMSLLPTIPENVRQANAELKQSVEDRLKGEGISWNWRHLDGIPEQIIVEQSRLADLIILNLRGEARAFADPPTSLAGSVAIHARAPVLAVPIEGVAFNVTGPALVAWNGSQECGHALRLTLSMVRAASAVHIVTVGQDSREFPAAEVSRYLARYEVVAEVHHWPGGEGSVADALVDAALSLRAAYIVMGAYGRVRFLETVFGGVTRDLLRGATPLVLAH